MSDVPVGTFLSGGLDSSIIAALVRPHVNELHTFSVGTEGSRDLEAARLVARHLDTVHHEYLLVPSEVVQKLPEIIYHLESFDQDLVRSAIPCYFTARLAAEEVKVILTGEGADELFAGYRYYLRYKDLPLLHREMRRSVQSLHNINLQRVDRMTMAHSIEGRVPFLDVEMIELAQSIPPELKLQRDGVTRPVEKWVLRSVWQPDLAHFGSLFWPTLWVDGLRSGLLLPDLYKGSIIKAVGMWESRWGCGISKGGGKHGKPGWFSMLSRARHFHGLVLVGRFSSFLPFVDGSAEAVGLGAGFQNVRSIGDSIEQCLAQPSIRDDLRPFGKRQVRGHNDGGSFGPFGDHLKQELRADLGQGHIPNLVNRDQIVAAPAGHHAP